MTIPAPLVVAKHLQWWGLAFMMMALPLSNFFMSFSIFWLIGVFFVHQIVDKVSSENWRGRWSSFFSNKYAVLFSSVYLIFLIAMFWSADHSFGFKDLKTKLPIFAMPILLSGMNAVTSKEVRALFIIYISALAVGVLVCLSVYVGWYNSIADVLHLKRHEVYNVREISIFISHIRFSLMLVFGICVLCLKFWNGTSEKIISTALIILFLLFMWIIESMTGFAILVALTLFSVLRYAIKAKSRIVRRAIVISLTISITIPTAFIIHGIAAYNRVEEIDLHSLNEYSASGEKYEHRRDVSQTENGHFVMLYIAWNELATEWNHRSAIDFEGKDKAGNPIKATLIRYLTSKGLRKDKVGVAQLNEEDIEQIESGIPNCTWKNKSGLQLRLEKLMFEYNNYRSGGNPGGHSVFQRVEFWKTGSSIIKQHLFFGVGTGDVKNAFVEEYARLNSSLDQRFRLRAHNQYMTVWISTGLLGLIWFLYVLFYPVWNEKLRRNTLYMCLWLIACFSFISEDTLESQAGISFFVFLTCFLVFLPRKGEVDQPLSAE